MSGAAEWAAALSGQAKSMTLRFQRLGLEAQCRALSGAEVGECLAIGGERGARYALWLSCDALREAGESLRKSGAVLSPFDITERLPYADALAAAGVLLRFSGAARPLVEAEGNEEEAEEDADWQQAVPAAFLREGGAAETEGQPPAAPARAEPFLSAAAAATAPQQNGPTDGAETEGRAVTGLAALPLRSEARAVDADAVAAALAARLCDAERNM